MENTITVLSELLVTEQDIQSGLYNSREAEIINKALNEALSAITAQEKPIDERFHQLANEYKAMVEKKIKALFEEGRDVITFSKNSVYLHFIDDNHYTDLQKINKEFELSYHLCTGPFSEPETTTLSELDFSALHELNLALDEKKYD